MKSILLVLIAAALAVITVSVTNTSTPGENDRAQRAVSEAASASGEPSAKPLKLDGTVSADASVTLPGSSVYQVDSEWIDQRGERVAWSSLQGRPRLVALFFTHCGYECPRIVHELKGILSEVPDESRRAVGVVLVSIDPEHDTPGALHSFGKTHGLEWPQWTLLTGTDPDVRELAAVLGTRFKQQPSGEFAHSNTIILIDERGDVVARRDGFDETTGALIAVLTTSDSKQR